MIVKTLSYTSRGGWSEKTFPALDSDNTLIIVFFSSSFAGNTQLIQELAKHYPKSKMIGCSSAGEIFGSHVCDDSLSVAITKFEKTKIRLAKYEIQSTNDSYDAGKNIARTLKGEDLSGVFVLSDGLQVNGSELVKGLNTIQKGNLVITGGLAGDGDRFKKTWSIFDGKILSGQVIGVGFYGKHIQIGHGSRGGWDIFGPERLVTKAKNNILYELDGQPALELYMEYLGERASGLPATGLLFPLAIRKDENDTHQLVRTILAVNEKEKSLTFAGDIPTGYLAQLMHANFDRLITAADEAGELATKSMIHVGGNQNTPVLSIAISCVGRRLLLGERTEEETESVLESLPKGTQQIGFYSYGELSPYEMGSCDLHNQTMTLTTITEDE